MYSKIAIKNVKKSFKDYTIYFLTLTLAVCIFYTFNSIGSQKAMTQMQQSGNDYVTMLLQIISYVSVFVSVILGSLMLYANNFLIKKRKKELGIYMTLGMGKQKISRILITETILVGIASLISGLLVGIVASQGLSVFTSKLFDVGMREYSFVFSIPAIGKTILYFGIMFLLVMVFNTVVISKYKIIDLLTAGRKNEDIKFKNPIIYFVTFILSVTSLAVAYNFILEINLNIDDPRFLASIILGVLGTVLFFFSLAGFILFIAKRSKKVYFKGLNIFVIKQLNSKVNTNFLSMSIISLMLFLTITVLSTGISFKTALESGLEASTPFDASARMFVEPEDKVQSIEQSFNNIGFKFEDGEKYAYLNIYDSKVSVLDLFNKNVTSESMKILNKVYYNLSMIKLSDYNNLRELKNEAKIELKNNEVLLLCNMSYVNPALEDFLVNNDTVKINNSEYVVKNKELINENLFTYSINKTFPTLVVNDSLTNNLEVTDSIVNINFSNDSKEKSEKRYGEFFANFIKGELDYDKTGFFVGSTKNQVYAESKGVTTTILFVGIYLGIVFLITSMAVLALQQLSEASDSIDRYKSLKKLGANNKMINKTIFIQTLIYFTLPIALAVIHSVVGIKVMNTFISMYNQVDIAGSSRITALILVVVYGGYFVATYSGYKNIIKTNIK